MKPLRVNAVGAPVAAKVPHWQTIQLIRGFCPIPKTNEPGKQMLHWRLYSLPRHSACGSTTCYSCSFLPAYSSLSLWADIPYDDTPFIKYFNANNIFVFLDYPPYNYFACLLWIPISLMVMAYDLLDQFRVNDAYHDQEISQQFYQWYTVTQVFGSSIRCHIYC